MKKLLKSALVVALASTTLFLQSCGEEETEAPDRSGEATISGTVKGNFNRTGNNPDDLEAAAGVSVKITYNSADLSYTGADAKHSYTIVKTVSTDGNGDFSVNVDATNEGDVTYTVSVDSYVANVQETTTSSKNYMFGGTDYDITVNSLEIGGKEFIQMDLEDGEIVIGQVTATVNP